VIALDTNLLVYAHRRDAPWHAEARRHIATLAEGQAVWAIPWPCIHEFLAVVTHPRIFMPPSTLGEAIGQVEAWLESPTLVLLAEGSTHWSALRAALQPARAVGPLVHDARIAALCRQHGVRELWTADRDFGRFPDLPVRNPLVG
jgi:toxin-antitoxin system PIN domain toxin